MYLCSILLFVETILSVLVDCVPCHLPLLARCPRLHNQQRYTAFGELAKTQRQEGHWHSPSGSMCQCSPIFMSIFNFFQTNKSLVPEISYCSKIHKIGISRKEVLRLCELRLMFYMASQLRTRCAFSYHSIDPRTEFVEHLIIFRI